MDYSIRQLTLQDLPQALTLVKAVFDEFEAPEYSAEGIGEFMDYIARDHLQARMQAGKSLLWGAFDLERIVGVIAIELGERAHINLLFVDADYHHRGVARRLFAAATDHYRGQGRAQITVNSSPYAKTAYWHLGFEETSDEQTVNGIRFIPMRYQI